MAEPPHRRIRAQGSPRDPSVMRFILDTPVQEGRGRNFDAPDDKAPLAAALFAIEGIRKVQVSGETIIVSLASGHGWGTRKQEVAAAIRQVLDRFPLPLGNVPQESDAAADKALLDAVNQVLDSRANPSIAQHGGRVTAESAEDGVVYLRMSGGCQGCAASSLTLRGGVERILRAAVPGIREIVDVTDHSAGVNPFYQGAPGEANTVLPFSVSSPEAEQKEPHVPERVDEAPASQMTATRLAERIRPLLVSLSRADVPTTYGKLARALGLYRPGSIRLVTDALEFMMHQDAAAGRAFLAARVASRGSGDLPGRGFFDLAAALGRGPEQTETWAEFHRRELEATFRSGKHAASTDWKADFRTS